MNVQGGPPWAGTNWWWQCVFCHAGWLENNKWGALWWVGALICFSTVHSDRRFGHKTCLSEICPKTDGSRAERDLPCSSRRFAAMCWSILKLHEDNNKWILVLWVWPGSKSPVITTEDWISKAKNGPPSSEQGECDVDSFLPPWKHGSPWVPTRSTVLKCSFGCMMQCGASDLHRESEVTGSCTVTTPLPTHPTLSRTSWLNIRNHKCCSPPYSPDMATCIFFSVPKGENAVEGK